MDSYSLWDRPWIPVLSRDGMMQKVSLRDALVLAPELREVCDPSPLVEVAVFRLLQAVVYRVFGLKNEAEWSALWKAGAFEARKVDGYGAEYADRFDLLHPTRPFGQVPDLKGAEHPISALVFEAASGNNALLFDHGLAEGGDSLALDRAACHLIAYPAFTIGFGRSTPFYLKDGPLTRGMVVRAIGRNLFESLLLNSLPLNRWKTHIASLEEDVPFWELDSPPEPKEEGTRPLGPMHYLTWQSRQIRLIADDTGERIVRCKISQRYALPKGDHRFDPYKPYFQSKKEGWRPYSLAKERSVWQYTHAFLHAGDPAGDRSAPALTDWIAEVIVRQARRHKLDLPSVIGYSVTGLVTEPGKAGKVDLWRREQLPIPVAYFEDQGLVMHLAELMGLAQRMESHLRRSGEALTWALAEQAYLDDAITYIWTGQVKEREKARSLEGHKKLAASMGLVARLWADLGLAFHRFLLGLPERGIESVRKEWCSTLIRIADKAFCELRDNLLSQENTFAVLAPVDEAFHHRLHVVLKDRQSGKEGTDDEESDAAIQEG